MQTRRRLLRRHITRLLRSSRLLNQLASRPLLSSRLLASRLFLLIIRLLNQLLLIRALLLSSRRPQIAIINLLTSSRLLKQLIITRALLPSSSRVPQIAIMNFLIRILISRLALLPLPQLIMAKQLSEQFYIRAPLFPS